MCNVNLGDVSWGPLIWRAWNWNSITDRERIKSHDRLSDH